MFNTRISQATVTWRVQADYPDQHGDSTGIEPLLMRIQIFHA